MKRHANDLLSIQYLSQLDNLQVTFNVKQKRLVDAVSTTLEMESYQLPRPHKVASVDLQEIAVQSKQDTMLQAMMERLDRLEKQVPQPTPPPTPVNRLNTIMSQMWSAGTFFLWLCQSSTEQPTCVK